MDDVKLYVGGGVNAEVPKIFGVEKVKNYTCKESDGVENEVKREDDTCVWVWMVVEDFE